MEKNQVDTYIAKSAEFAQPILNHFRALVHKTCPNAEEKIKWGFPHFDYENGPMCHMAAFKKHCAIGFWKAALMKESKNLLSRAQTEEAMGHLGRITSLKDLPSDKIIIGYIKDAMRINEAGLKLPAKKKPADKTELVIPDYFVKVLSKNKKAQKAFEAFSPGHKKEYVMWMTEAKTEETRQKGMATAIEWLSEGKSRNWKYKK